MRRSERSSTIPSSTPTVTASAFDAARNPGGLRLHTTFGSDIGRWDVPLMAEVLEEVHAPLEEGLVDEDDLRDFVFANPARLWTATNPGSSTAPSWSKLCGTRSRPTEEPPHEL